MYMKERSHYKYNSGIKDLLERCYNSSRDELIEKLGQCFEVFTDEQVEEYYTKEFGCDLEHFVVPPFGTYEPLNIMFSDEELKAWAQSSNKHQFIQYAEDGTISNRIEMLSRLTGFDQYGMPFEG